MEPDALAQERLRLSLVAWAKGAAWVPFLSHLMGPGQRLDLGAQQRLEAIFGRDLSEVRIHDTRQAGEIAHRLGAEAFTTGSHIFAAPDGLAPGTPRGEALLAHELMHFVQQNQPSSKARAGLEGPTEQMPKMPSSFFPRGEAAGLPNQAAWGSLPVQLADEVPATEPDAMEAQALAVEETNREGTGERAGATDLDPHEIADRVYRLMRDDLRLERERRAFPY